MGGGIPLHGEEWALFPVLGDQDVLLIDDALLSIDKKIAVGDFDGDGEKDIAVLGTETINYPDALIQKALFLFRGPSWKNEVLFSEEVDLKIQFPYIPFVTGPFDVLFLDITGDKKDELVIRVSSIVYIFEGRDPVPASLNVSEASAVVFGPRAVSGVSGGDLDHDGRSELVIGYAFPGGPAVTEWHILKGNPSFPMESIDTSVAATKKIMGPSGMDPQLQVTDIDGDGWGDMVLSGYRLTIPEVDILFGKADFPADWDLRTTSANVRILVSDYDKTYPYIFGSMCGDLTGDHRSEMLLRFVSNTYLVSHSYLLDGGLLTPGTIISGTVGDPHYVPPLPVLASTHSMTSSAGDFDGDGRADLLLGINLLLSSDRSPGALSEITSPSLQIRGPEIYSSQEIPFVFSDLNNDGHDDLIVFSPAEKLPGIYGGLFIVYGHRLLRDPSIHIRPRTPPSPHVTLTLSVEGDPVDMMISGPITDPFRDQWIPFATSLDVTLSSPEGAKQVKAKFRNAVGRVSAEAVDTLTLSAPAPQVLPFTNWVDNHGEVRAQFDCSLPTAGRVRAWVLDPRGVEIKELMNSDHPAGIVSVEWDGTNGSGRKVSRGVYYVVIDSNGRSQHRVIVE